VCGVCAARGAGIYLFFKVELLVVMEAPAAYKYTAPGSSDYALRPGKNESFAARGDTEIYFAGRILY